MRLVPRIPWAKNELVREPILEPVRKIDRVLVLGERRVTGQEAEQSVLKSEGKRCRKKGCCFCCFEIAGCKLFTAVLASGLDFILNPIFRCAQPVLHLAGGIHSLLETPMGGN